MNGSLQVSEPVISASFAKICKFNLSTQQSNNNHSETLKFTKYTITEDWEHLNFSIVGSRVCFHSHIIKKDL